MLIRKSIMLTGGKSAKIFYSRIARSSYCRNYLSRMNFFWGDERVVPLNHCDSNYEMARKCLLSRIDVDDACINPIRALSGDVHKVAFEYSSIVPDSVDVLLLSIGEDGHIASLFPNSPALSETERKVMPVIGPKAPFQRLTITPPVIQSAKRVYVLAIGDEKKRKYEEALLDPEDISSIPARLVLDRTWIFDLDEEIDLCPKP